MSEIAQVSQNTSEDQQSDARRTKRKVKKGVLELKRIEEYSSMPAGRLARTGCRASQLNALTSNGAAALNALADGLQAIISIRDSIDALRRTTSN